MPKQIPNNHILYLLRVAAKDVASLKVFGKYCPNRDGTGVSDCIHMVDLAVCHTKVLAFLRQHKGYDCFNLGTGQSYSVIEVLKTFELVNQITIPLEMLSRRPGDSSEHYAASDNAKNFSPWRPNLPPPQVCKTAWD